MSTGVIISRPVEYCTYVYFFAYRFQLLHVAAYIYHIGVGSSVVCSTVSGNAKASEGGTDGGRFPRFFVCIASNIVFMNEPSQREYIG